MSKPLCPINRLPCTQDCACFMVFKNRYYLEFETFKKAWPEQKIDFDHLTDQILSLLKGMGICGINQGQSYTIVAIHKDERGRPTGADINFEDGECAMARFFKGARTVRDNHIVIDAELNEEGDLIWEQRKSSWT